MKNKIAFLTSLISVVSILLVFLLGITITRNNNYEQAKNNAAGLANTLSTLYDGDNTIVDSASKNYRITIIDNTGKVLADSDNQNVDTMENHISREEIIAALEGTPKAIQRKSETTGKSMIYYAVKIDFEGSYVFIRTAVYIESINAYVKESIPLMIAIAMTAILCAVICSVFMAAKTVEPLRTVKKGLLNLKEGEYKKISATSPDKEIQDLIVDINSIGETLGENLEQISREKKILSRIVNSINDGLVLFDGTDISLINEGAKNIFKCTDAVIGKNTAALTQNRAIINAVSSAAKTTEWNSFECEEQSRIIICSIKPVENGNNNLILAVFSDITAERNSEKIRSDFFANAGHELKTPLTAISGFNELISQQDKDDTFKRYTTQISSNAERMLNLVNDMLRLSELENAKPTNEEIINIEEIAKTVKTDLQVLAESKNITLEITGKATVNATETHIYELIKNLVENSIKYGKENGNVKISLSEVQNNTIIEVSDDGIGIDEKHQSRIFERFYRVEKSRSRATGGTGLGLSIVKHIVLLYGGEIAIKSKPAIGTTITISFKKT